MPSIDGKTDRSNGASGTSDIEGKVTRVGASERGQQTSFNGALGKVTHLRQGYSAPSIEGKAAMGSGERAGKRGSFKWAGAHEAMGKRASFKIPRSPAKMMLQRRRVATAGLRTLTEQATVAGGADAGFQ